MKKRQSGFRGESVAAAFLNDNGYNILARNYYVRGGEVDIICKKDDTIVFCEVKLRGQSRFGRGAEAVDIRKQRCICRAALDYAYRNGHMEKPIRFDIIEVQNERISHIKNAFEFVQP